MILTRTPYRVSLFGGGTDYPEYFEHNEGHIVGMAINKYCYVGIKRMPPGQELAPGIPLQYRVQYSKVDDCNYPAEIKHPAVRAAVQEYRLGDQALEFHCFGDLPGRSGLGGSSSFTVGLLLALASLLPHRVNREFALVKDELAMGAIHLEREVIGEAVGCQDQMFAALGGLNHMVFSKDSRSCRPLNVGPTRARTLEDSLFLVFTGVMRDAHVMAAKQIANFSQRGAELKALAKLAVDATSLLEGQWPLDDLGAMLGDAWRRKISLCDGMAPPEVISTYAKGMDAGATGGKLLGAGGGGFMLFYVPFKNQGEFIHRMNPVKFNIDYRGARVIIDEA